MLEIITEGLPVDIKPDTEISITIENPFMTADGIPVPYSMTYELPLSPRNREVFGFPDRSASKEWFKSRETRILFNGIEIAYGQQMIDEVTRVLNVNFNGVIFPQNIRKYLSSQDLGKLELGKCMPAAPSKNFFLDTTNDKYNDFLINELKIEYPSAPWIVAPPMGIKGATWIHPGYDGTPMQMENSLNFYLPPDGYVRRGQYDIRLYNIMPAFLVGMIIDYILDQKVKKSIFKSTEWKRLMLVSRYHPVYDMNRSYDIDIVHYPDEMYGMVTFADFMPAMSANDFIVEMLKLPCAVLYMKGAEFNIEFKKEILARNIVHEWSGKIIGTPSIMAQTAQKYKAGYSDNSQERPSEYDGATKSIKSLYDIEYLPASRDSKIYRIDTTRQYIKLESEPGEKPSNRYKYSLIAQIMSQIKDENNEDDSSETYDNTSSVSVVTPNLQRVYQEYDIEGTDSPLLRQFRYMPEIDAPEKERTANLVVGLYYGMQDSIVFDTNVTPVTKYPYLTHCNYDAYGNRLGDLSLVADGDDGLIENYHKDFKAWVEKDKTILKANVLLTAEDLNKLDLRDKFYINGITYFIKTLTVTITARRIKPAEVEFVEV